MPFLDGPPVDTLEGENPTYAKGGTVIARVPADGPEVQLAPTFTFETAERGLGYAPGVLRRAADEAGWTSMDVLTAETLCDVLCLLWPYPEE